jgi:hypothetical protein
MRLTVGLTKNGYWTLNSSCVHCHDACDDHYVNGKRPLYGDRVQARHQDHARVEYPKQTMARRLPFPYSSVAPIFKGGGCRRPSRRQGFYPRLHQFRPTHFYRAALSVYVLDVVDAG